MINPSFVVIGGGTGTFSILSGLKKYTDNITAIVNMADSGGSAKKERDEWGLLPSSDIRKSLLALADISTEDNLLLRELFRYRYSEGVGIEGMTFGNLFLIALTKLLGSQTRAIEKAGEILRIKGKVLPVTLTACDLVAHYADGSTVVGEHFIDEPKHNGTITIRELSLTPKATVTTDAKEAVIKADYIIIGPGSFYTTILATLIVDGVAKAVRKSKAKKIFISNLMTEYGQTYSFTAKQFINELDKYLSGNILDYVLINNESIPDSILVRYKRYHATPVINDLSDHGSYRVITADFLSKKLVKQEKGDTLRRSLVRHSPEKIAKACMRIAAML